MSEFKMVVPLDDDFHPNTFKGIFTFERVHIEKDPDDENIIHMSYEMEGENASKHDNWRVQINLKNNTIKGQGSISNRQWIKYCLAWYKKTLDDEVLYDVLIRE